MSIIVDVFYVVRHCLSLGFDLYHLHVIYLVDEASGYELVKEEEGPGVTQHIPGSHTWVTYWDHSAYTQSFAPHLATFQVLVSSCMNTAEWAHNVSFFLKKNR